MSRTVIRRGGRFTRALILISLTAVSGCASRRVVESVLLRNHFGLTQGLPYGNNVRQRLDVYRPRRAEGPAPVIVFLYGGRWQYGSKDEYRLVGDAITRRGLVAVVPDYRLYPEVRFPSWVEDAAHAVGWVHDNIQRFGGDPARIVVVGHSAGAHTSALLGLDEHYLRQAGVPADAVRGFVSLAGPVATVWTDADVQALMGPRKQWSATYPMAQVGGREPPLLLLQGGRDKTVSHANAGRLAAHIVQRGGCARAIIYAGLNHVGIVVALALDRFNIAPVLEDVLRFSRAPAAYACRAPS